MDIKSLNKTADSLALRVTNSGRDVTKFVFDALLCVWEHGNADPLIRFMAKVPAPVARDVATIIGHVCGVADNTNKPRVIWNVKDSKLTWAKWGREPGKPMAIDGVKARHFQTKDGAFVDYRTALAALRKDMKDAQGHKGFDPVKWAERNAKHIIDGEATLEEMIKSLRKATDAAKAKAESKAKAA